MKTDMDVHQIAQKLQLIKQSHILDYWPKLSAEQKKRLTLQIQKLNVEVFCLQQNLIKSPEQSSLQSFEPFKDYETAGSESDFAAGKKMISEGLLGCLIVAGGQGTRLSFEGPKGMFPVTPVLHKSLFQLFAEKTLAAGKQAGRPLMLAVMTSPLNHLETKEFFDQNENFGLASSQLTFFQQGTLPFLDQEGSLFLEKPDLIAEGPDGNGSTLKHFYESNTWKRWKEQGIKYVNFILIDNPLADPYDAELLGFHVRQANDVTLKCTKRRSSEEKVGTLVRTEKKVSVIEYSEMPILERQALQSDGALRHVCANLSLFLFSMDFVEVAASRDLELPLHLAFKTAKFLKPHGGSSAWKFEKFIFDVLEFTDKCKALLYPREVCFSPLKNKEGADSLDTVQTALQDNDRRVLSQITGHLVENSPLEISQEFYYPTPSLIQKWKGKQLTSSGYIG